MTTTTSGIVSRAIAHIRFSVFTLQWADNLFILVLAALWLQIPDSHAWQFAFSILSAAAVIIGFCWIQIATFARIRPAAAPANLWLRILGFALVAALWLLLVQWIKSGSDSIPDYAYFWNSKLSPGVRIVFSPARIVTSLNILLDVIIWTITALLLPIAIVLSTDGLRHPAWRDARRPYRHILYWAAVFLFCIIVTQLTSALASWIPGKGLPGSHISTELMSVTLRLALAWTTDVLLWCLLLAFTAAWMQSAPVPAPAPAPPPEPKPAS
jgi:hypothetical protein